MTSLEQELLKALKEVKAGIDLVSGFVTKEISDAERKARIEDYKEHQGGSL